MAHTDLARFVENQGIAALEPRFFLDRSHDLAQQYLNIAGVIFVALDANGVITLMNRKGHEVLEYSEGELLGKSWFETCVPAERRPAVTAIFQKLISGDIPSAEHAENLVVTRTGRVRIIAWHNTVLRAKDGRCAGTLSSGEDITDRRHAEESLRASEERFRFLVEASPDAIVLCGLDGRILTANHQAATLGGFPGVDDLMAGATNGFAFLAIEDHERALDEICELAASGVLRNVEHVVVRPDGTRVPIELNAVLLEDSSDEPASMMCVVRDISARKATEERLAAAAREWSVSFDAMPDGVSIHSADHTVLKANRALCDLLGQSKESIIGKKCYEVFHGGSEPPADCPLERSRTTLRQESSEFFEPTLGRWLAASTSPVLNEQGRLVQLVHLVRDITERKKAEEELRETQRQAVAANRAKSAFLANMSHEIRTPMTAILGFADLLLNAHPSPDERHAYLETIKRNGDALLELINDILDLSKIEADKMSLELIDCSLRRVLDEALALVKVRAEKKGLDLRIDVDASAPETLRTDPLRLRQILVNLLGNAIKFTERGGVGVSVRGNASAVDAVCVTFAVSDTGIGIPADKIDEVFEPFTQADISTTRRFGGTGLGLAISKRLANLLGGDIATVSEPGHGSTFTLTIESNGRGESITPLTTRDFPSAESKPVEKPRKPAVTRRVLLAEDIADVQGLWRLALRRSDVSIDVAENGRAACEMASQSMAEGRPYDLILMDVQMPELDGLDATRWLRGAGWQGPIVALTAYAMPGDREKCIEAGCDDHVAKAVQLNDLRAVVARYVGAASIDDVE